MKYIVALMLIYLLGAGLESKTGEAGAVFQVSGAAQAQGPYDPPANADAIANERMFAPPYQGPQSLTPMFDWRSALGLILVIAGIVCIMAIIMQLTRMSYISQKFFAGINRMCDDISRNSVSIAPWSGFWYYLMSFVRCNIIIFFSLFWTGISNIDIYTRVMFLCISFILDRIAVRKAEDVAIKTVYDFKIYAERNLTEEESNHKVQIFRLCIKYSSWTLVLLVLVESLIHASAVLSNMTERRVNITIYEIAGILYFYILSAHFLVSVHNLRITNDKLNNAYAWNVMIFWPMAALTWRWIGPFYYTANLVMVMLFLIIINKAEHSSGLFDYIKYGSGFFLLAMVLSLYPACSMAFKGAAYAHYLGQKVKP